jgi:hypothetical protein
MHTRFFLLHDVLMHMFSVAAEKLQETVQLVSLNSEEIPQVERRELPGNNS